MRLTAQLPAGRREHVEDRLRGDPIGWFTTVRPSGQPDSVPVWFLVQDDETIVVYSQPGRTKLRNLTTNPRTTLTLDDTATGQDVVRIEGTARHAPEHPPATAVPDFLAKYERLIASGFGTPERFAQLFSEPVLITPTRLHA